MTSALHHLKCNTNDFYLVSSPSSLSCVGVASPVSSEITLVTLLKLTADSVGPPVAREVGGGR